jgi:hypothetical protein
MTDLQALPNRTCPLCGGPNQCAPAHSGRLDVACWCSAPGVSISPEVLARVPAAELGRACICSRCAGVAPRVPPESDVRNHK